MKSSSGQKSEKIDLEGYQPLPVVYQLRYSILEKIKKGEDPLPDIQGREEVNFSCSIISLSTSFPGTGQ